MVFLRYLFVLAAPLGSSASAAEPEAEVLEQLRATPARLPWLAPGDTEHKTCRSQAATQAIESGGCARPNCLMGDSGAQAFALVFTGPLRRHVPEDPLDRIELALAHADGRRVCIETAVSSHLGRVDLNGFPSIPWLHDLDGDGVAEIALWGEVSSDATKLHAPMLPTFSAYRLVGEHWTYSRVLSSPVMARLADWLSDRGLPEAAQSYRIFIEDTAPGVDVRSAIGSDGAWSPAWTSPCGVHWGFATPEDEQRLCLERMRLGGDLRGLHAAAALVYAAAQGEDTASVERAVDTFEALYGPLPSPFLAKWPAEPGWLRPLACASWRAQLGMFEDWEAYADDAPLKNAAEGLGQECTALPNPKGIPQDR